MNIVIIGRGNVGRGLARLWSDATIAFGPATAPSRHWRTR